MRHLYLGLLCTSLWLADANKSMEHGSFRRQLQLSEIAGYEPYSTVTDVNAIDLDLTLMVAQLGGHSEASFGNAVGIYVNGGNVAPYSNRTLKLPLAHAVPGGTRVTGVNSNIGQVVGFVMGDHPFGSKHLAVKYLISSNQANYVGCKVGGLPSANAQVTEGCFVSVGGVAIPNIGPYQYEYTVMDQTFSSISLSTLSTELTDADANMIPMVQRYKSYYGILDYGDHFVRSALQAAPTTLFTKGQFDFSSLGFPGRAIAAGEGAVTLNVWLGVIVEMYRAVGTCRGTFQDGSTAQTHWDQAVAFYTGSLEGPNGLANGKLLHQLADDMCADFRTCGSNSDGDFGRSFVNQNVLANFEAGKPFLTNSNQDDCNRLEELAQNIEIYMKIALVQGTLKFAFDRRLSSTSELTTGVSTAFTTAILPQIYACSPLDAATIYRNMAVDSASVQFLEVKQALEKNYECLGITCKSVGGFFIKAFNTYYVEADPCTDDRPLHSIGVTSLAPAPTPVLHDRTTLGPAATTRSNPSGGGDDTAVIAGSVSAVLVVTIAAVAVLFYMVKRNKESDPVSRGNAPEFTPPADSVKESAAELI